MKLCSLDNKPEVFFSIQGEGSTIGKPAVFVRLQGCNLKCKFCDTAYSWDLKDRIDLIPEKVRDEIVRFNCKRVIFTGGEPLLQQDDIWEVMNLLRKYTFEIETNGTIFPSFRSKIQWNVSPKLSNSGNKHNQNIEAIYCFVKAKNSIFKFVIQEIKDLYEVLDFITKYNIPKEKIYLMPEGITSESLKEKEKYIIEICKEYNFNYSPRLHIEVYGDKRGV